MRQIAEYRLRNKHDVPPGFWQARDHNGTIQRAPSWRRICKLLPFPEEEVENRVCQMLIEQGHEHYLDKSIRSIFDQGVGEITRIDDTRLYQPSKYNYNPSICIHDGKRLMAYRMEMEKSGLAGLYLCELGDDWQPVVDTAKYIDLPKHYDGDENYEDPRIYSFHGKLWLSYGNWGRDWKKYRPTQMFAILNDDFSGYSVKVKKDWMPKYGRNGQKDEKNWLLFQDPNIKDKDESMRCLYNACPHTVFAVSDSRTTVSPWRHEGWQNGIRGGTPPVLHPHDGLFYTFCRSHEDSDGRGRGRYKGRQYTIGCYAFEPTAPYRVVKYTPKPLLVASDEDEYLSWAPCVVFSSGCVWDNDQFVVSLGVHDFWPAIWKADMAVLKEEMVEL